MLKFLNFNYNHMQIRKYATKQIFIKISKHKFCSYQGDNIMSTLGRSSGFRPLSLSDLRDNEGSRTAKTILGRGPGCGKGKTSGRGHKGYKARVGNVSRYFEGGQSPLTRRLPKHGFRRKGLKENFNYINLDKIIYLILKGRIDPSKVITIRDLFWAGGISKLQKGLKVLSKGAEGLKDLPPLNLEVSSATQRTIDEIKKYGGNVTCIYRNTTTLKAHVKPWRFYRTPLDPLPPYKKTLRLLHLEDKGAKVQFVRPNWLNLVDPRERELKIKKRISNHPLAKILPQYPVKITPHMSDDRIRQRKPKLWKKITFDTKI